MMAGSAMGAVATAVPTAATAKPTVRSILKNFGVGLFILFTTWFIIHV
jgi:hypothetical protein